MILNADFTIETAGCSAATPERQAVNETLERALVWWGRQKLALDAQRPNFTTDQLRRLEAAEGWLLALASEFERQQALTITSDDLRGRSGRGDSHGMTTREKELESENLKLRTALARVQEVVEQMRAFVATKPGGQHTRTKTPKEMVEYFAWELATALAGTEKKS